MLPLNKFHEILPKEGIIVEVGCGHGIVCQYLAPALRSSKRKLLGFDPDESRINIAQKASAGVF